MVWEPVLTWDCECTKVDVSKLEITGKTFSCYIAGSSSVSVDV